MPQAVLQAGLLGCPNVHEVLAMPRLVASPAHSHIAAITPSWGRLRIQVNQLMAVCAELWVSVPIEKMGVS